MDTYKDNETAGAERETDSALAKTALEQRYIHLLELRVAQLEAIVSQGESKTVDTASSPADTNRDDQAGVTGQNSEQPVANSSSKDADVTKDSIPNGDDTVSRDGKDGSKAESEEGAAPGGVKQVIATWNESEGLYEDTETSKFTDQDQPSTVKPQSGAIFRRVMDDDNPNKTNYDEIELTSLALQRLFCAACPTYTPPSDESGFDTSSITVRSPFVPFIWFWDNLEAASKLTDDDSLEYAAAKADLRQVMSLVRKTNVEPYFKQREAFSGESASANIPYEYLWTIFSPGTMVYAKTYQEDCQMLEVVSCSLPIRPDATDPKNPAMFIRNEFRVSAAAFDWDGIKFRVIEYDFFIKKDGKQDTPVHALKVFPTTYYRDELGNRNDQKLRVELTERGRKFWQLCNIESDDVKCRYKDTVFTSSVTKFGRSQLMADQTEEDDNAQSSFDPDEREGRRSRKVEYFGQSIVDARSYLRSQPWLGADPPLGDLELESWTEVHDSGCQCGICAKSLLADWYNQALDAEVEDHYERFKDNEMRLRMCPPRVLGYALNARMWAQFRIQSLAPDSRKSDERQQFFDNQLQLDKEYKQLLMAFVNNHETSQGSRRYQAAGANGSVPNSLDVIEGKGNGLAILLHGPPGVGKTLTAETIALATGRPLLVISVAEIGTVASKAEARLSGILANAARWRAVLLVDEADVFLEERSNRSANSSNRNALVSVLLRCLEYYEGIIILTTNRITAFDVAVQSRMHLAIQYKDLTEVQKHEIFKNLLAKVPDSKIVGSRADLYRNVQGLCRRNFLNGRQIRNIVSAALSLAKSDEQGSERLSYEHLRRVFETTMDFLDCLKDLTKKKRTESEAPY